MTRGASTGASPTRRRRAATTTPAAPSSRTSRLSSTPGSGISSPSSPRPANDTGPNHEEGGSTMTAHDDHASVRYIVDDVQAAIDFYTTHLGFMLTFSAVPAFADVRRGPLRL